MPLGTGRDVTAQVFGARVDEQVAFAEKSHAMSFVVETVSRHRLDLRCSSCHCPAGQVLARLATPLFGTTGSFTGEPRGFSRPGSATVAAGSTTSTTTYLKRSPEHSINTALRPRPIDQKDQPSNPW